MSSMPATAFSFLGTTSQEKRKMSSMSSCLKVPTDVLLRGQGNIHMSHCFNNRLEGLQAYAFHQNKNLESIIQGDVKEVLGYLNHHHILLIGDGDLRWAEFMANEFGQNNHNITATTLETESELTEMYPSVGSRIQRITNLGVMFVPGIDGTKLKTSMAPYLINPRNVDEFVYPKVQILFDRVIFMFPFGGKVYNAKTPWKFEVHSKLLQDVFVAAKTLLGKDGQIHVTMNTGPPYKRWRIGQMADLAGLKEVGREDFDVKKCLSYRPKKGCGPDANTEITLSKPCTFMYGLK